MNLGQWLRKTPHPHTVDVDGKKVTVGVGGGKWRDLVRTIETLKGEKITALDSAGNVIRAYTIEDDAEEKPAPAGTSDIQVFAGLIAEAYDKGHKAQQPVHSQALEFIERLSTRLAAAERECDRLRLENARLRGQVIEVTAASETGGGDEDTSIAAALMQGIAAAASGGNGIAPPQPVPARRPQPQPQQHPKGGKS